MRKIFVSLTVIIAFLSWQSLHAVDMGGGYTDSMKLSEDAATKAISYLDLSDDQKVFQTYNAGKDSIIVRVKKPLRAFVAHVIEKKVYQTREELTNFDRALGNALVAGDANFKSWLKNFYNADFQGLKGNYQKLPDGPMIHETWKKAFIDSGILGADGISIDPPSQEDATLTPIAPPASPVPAIQDSSDEGPKTRLSPDDSRPTPPVQRYKPQPVISAPVGYSAPAQIIAEAPEQIVEEAVNPDREKWLSEKADLEAKLGDLNKDLSKHQEELADLKKKKDKEDKKKKRKKLKKKIDREKDRIDDIEKDIRKTEDKLADVNAKLG